MIPKKPNTLYKQVAEDLNISETPPIKSTSNQKICTIDIPIENDKFSAFKYRVDVCQYTWGGITLCFRAFDGTTVKNHGRNPILQNVRNTICKNGYDKGGGTWEVLKKTIIVGSSQLNFSKLDDGILVILEDSKKLEALVNSVTEECRTLTAHVKNIFESDK